VLNNAVNTAEGLTGSGDGTANGITLVSVVTSGISNLNFGIQIPPVATSNSLTSQPNVTDGNTISIPGASFTGTDPEGALSGVYLKYFPTSLASFTVGAATYTFSTWPATGVT